MFKNNFRLGMVDSGPCTTLVRNAVNLEGKKSSVGSLVRVGLCATRGEIIVFEESPQYKKICADVSLSHSGVKILPT